MAVWVVYVSVYRYIVYNQYIYIYIAYLFLGKWKVLLILF